MYSFSKFFQTPSICDVPMAAAEAKARYSAIMLGDDGERGRTKKALISLQSPIRA
jgi:hypothetical protein